MNNCNGGDGITAQEEEEKENKNVFTKKQQYEWNLLIQILKHDNTEIIK